MAVLINENKVIETKEVSISSKRQLTIPMKYYTMLGFGQSAECYVRGDELVIRPIKRNTGGEFAEQILEDLVGQGYSGQELIRRFKEMQTAVRPAVDAMMEDARMVAESKAEYGTYEDIFGGEDAEL